MINQADSRSYILFILDSTKIVVTTKAQRREIKYMNKFISGIKWLKKCILHPYAVRDYYILLGTQ